MLTTTIKILLSKIGEYPSFEFLRRLLWDSGSLGNILSPLIQILKPGTEIPFSDTVYKALKIVIILKFIILYDIVQF